MANKHMKRRVSTLLAAKETSIIPIKRYHYTFTRMIKIKEKIVATPNAGGNAEKLYHSCTVGGMLNDTAILVKSWAHFVQN